MNQGDKLLDRTCLSVCLSVETLTATSTRHYQSNDFVCLSAINFADAADQLFIVSQRLFTAWREEEMDNVCQCVHACVRGCFVRHAKLFMSSSKEEKGHGPLPDLFTYLFARHSCPLRTVHCNQKKGSKDNKKEWTPSCTM